jgi:thiamine-phosphate pyrophosphorylase
MLLYYITDRTQLAHDEPSRRNRLPAKVAEASQAGVDYIQLREKDLPSRELEELARTIVRRAREGGNARVLINSRTDIALSADADGVHLRSNDISPADVRRIWRAAGKQSQPIVATSCHTEEQIVAAKFAGADFVVLGPVFGKSAVPAVGLRALSSACAHGLPVLALGGVTAENASSCLHAGAAGVAGIRLFQGSDLKEIVRRLRS